MKRTNLATLFLLGAIMLTGCFSIARYQANVRPDTVSASPTLKGKYRLARILLNTTSGDATYNSLLASLRTAHKALAAQIEPKVYEYGFLKG